MLTLSGQPAILDHPKEEEKVVINSNSNNNVVVVIIYHNGTILRLTIT